MWMEVGVKRRQSTRVQLTTMRNSSFLWAIICIAALSFGSRTASAQVRACATPTPLGTKNAEVVIGVLTSADSTYRAFARAMGVAGLSASDFVVVTDSTVCSAVTNAIVATRGKTAYINYLVIHAGSRFLALDPAGRSSLLYSVDSAYGDLRTSLR